MSNLTEIIKGFQAPITSKDLLDRNILFADQAEKGRVLFEHMWNILAMICPFENREVILHMYSSRLVELELVSPTIGASILERDKRKIEARKERELHSPLGAVDQNTIAIVKRGDTAYAVFINYKLAEGTYLTPSGKVGVDRELEEEGIFSRVEMLNGQIQWDYKLKRKVKDSHLHLDERRYIDDQSVPQASPPSITVEVGPGEINILAAHIFEGIKTGSLDPKED